MPPYCRSRDGRVYRVMRSSKLVAPDTVRFVLRVQPVRARDDERGLELSRELDADLVRDKIANGQAVPTPESTFEELWQQLRRDIDVQDEGSLS